MKMTRSKHLLHLAPGCAALLLTVALAGSASAQFDPANDPVRDFPRVGFPSLPVGKNVPIDLPETRTLLSAETLIFRNTYTLATQAYIYGFPHSYLYWLRWYWTNVPADPENIPFAPVNYFWHNRTLAQAVDPPVGGSPNNDTLYSMAWVDVTDEPVILSHPEIPGNRYFTFEIAGQDSDNFAYVGSRTTGNEAGAFAMIGPDWNCPDDADHGNGHGHWRGDDDDDDDRSQHRKRKKKRKGRQDDDDDDDDDGGSDDGGKGGEFDCLPEGVEALPRSRTNSILINGRTLVDGEDDIPNVTALQDQYDLTLLSLWETGIDNPITTGPAPADPDDELGDWKDMVAAWEEFPPEDRHESLYGWFETIGIGRGLDVEDTEGDVRRALIAARQDANEMIFTGVQESPESELRGTWKFPPGDEFGRAGLADNYFLRASVQCMGGIVANDEAEAVYPNTNIDVNGDLLVSGTDYTLRFGPDEFPEFVGNGFWSLTIYRQSVFDLIFNPIERYSIGNRTEGLNPDEDGGLTIYVQNTDPGGDKTANWLPSDQDDEELIYLVLRIYRPAESVTEGGYTPPPLVPND